MSREETPKPVLRCIYCGRRLFRGHLTKASSLACSLHRDLLSVDPVYTPPDQWAEAR